MKDDASVPVPRAPLRALYAARSRVWLKIGTRFLPFADVASAELPLSRLLRLSLFQVSVGMALVMLTGTLNRVMIVELSVPAALVAAMVALPVLFAPFRMLIGFRSDHRRSALGWRRVPYLWMGTLLQFGGLAILPFALILLSGDTRAPAVVGQAGAAVAFLLLGLGLHTTQTAGLALATDLAPARLRARVVPLLYVMLLLGMVISAVVFGLLLANFSPLRLIQVIQGAAVATVVLNVVALWKQEARVPCTAAQVAEPRPRFGERLSSLFALGAGAPRRLMLTVALGTAGLSMQDILLEPYGAQVMGMGVGATTMLTALQAAGMLAGFALSARMLGRGFDAHRLAAVGALLGLVAFSLLTFSAPLRAGSLLVAAAFMIGAGAGLFSVGTLTATMALDAGHENGLALGVWGAVQATAAGVGIAGGGFIRDLCSAMAVNGALGEALADPATGYLIVYHLEVLLLFVALVAIGPLARHAKAKPVDADRRFGLQQFPG
ncbi:MAG: MFS transporter [Lautropia sp.]